ncbi:MAG: hypothetical protein Q7K45_01295, partial [Nanoarchaeota archaeon]|nr:hypothetical protein [Nanoarchaeota archaeon]
MKYWLFVVFASLLVVLSACTNTGATVGVDACSDFEGTAKDNCYQENLQCSKIKNRDVRDSCVVELAKLKNDLQVCKLIVGERVQAYCQQQIAILQNDHAICSD